MKNVIGKKLKLKEDASFFVKEGHEVGGHSTATTLSAGNTIEILGKRNQPGDWYEAQVKLTERFEPPYGGETIRWRGIILIHADQIKKLSA